MKAFLYGTVVQLKMQARNREVLVHYYAVPFVFYLFMGGIFTSIMPDARSTLIQTMTVFGVTMGAVLGSPYPLVEVFGGEIKKAYQIGGIPLWTVALGNSISAFAHCSGLSLLIFFTAPLVFKAELPPSLSAYFAGLGFFIMASLSVGMVFGLCVKTQSKLGMMTQLVFLPSIMLSGIMFPASMLPPALRYAGKLMPAHWGFEAMIAHKVDIGLVLPLMLMTALLALVSAWRLKKSRCV